MSKGTLDKAGGGDCQPLKGQGGPQELQPPCPHIYDTHTGHKEPGGLAQRSPVFMAGTKTTMLFPVSVKGASRRKAA